MKINERIEEVFEEAVQIRRLLHSQPELSQKEINTSRLISSFLSQYEIEHATGIGGHGVVAVIRGKGKPIKGQRFFTIGIRADMDALPIEERVQVPFKSKIPGIMHACGHDIHMAVLMGTTKVFKEMEDQIPGNIKFFFEPAEETIGGAKAMIEEGCLENPRVDVVIGLHVSPELEAGKIQFKRGKMNAASTEFEITIGGSACHGAHPENGIDSIAAASSVVCALQSIITRNISPTNPAVITVGQIHGGTKNNVLAKETVFSGIIRALDSDTKSFIKSRVKEMAENVARGFGATAEVLFTDSFPALINDDEVEDMIESAAKKVFSKDQIHFLQEPSLGADDFSYFSEAVRAVYFNIGCLDTNENNYQTLHNEMFNPSEECIRTGMLMEVFGVLELFQQTK